MREGIGEIGARTEKEQLLGGFRSVNSRGLARMGYLGVTGVLNAWLCTYVGLARMGCSRAGSRWCFECKGALLASEKINENINEMENENENEKSLIPLIAYQVVFWGSWFSPTQTIEKPLLNHLSRATIYVDQQFLNQKIVKWFVIKTIKQRNDLIWKRFKSKMTWP